MVKTEDKLGKNSIDWPEPLNSIIDVIELMERNTHVSSDDIEDFKNDPLIKQNPRALQKLNDKEFLSRNRHLFVKERYLLDNAEEIYQSILRCLAELSRRKNEVHTSEHIVQTNTYEDYFKLIGALIHIFERIDRFNNKLRIEEYSAWESHINTIKQKCASLIDFYSPKDPSEKVIDIQYIKKLPSTQKYQIFSNLFQIEYFKYLPYNIKFESLKYLLQDNKITFNLDRIEQFISIKLSNEEDLVDLIKILFKKIEKKNKAYLLKIFEDEI